MGTPEIPSVHVGMHSFSSGFEGDSGFQMTPFSFDLLMLFMLVWWSWVSALIWKWHWPARIKSLMLLLLLLRAAWPGWVLTWGISGAGSVLPFQHPANSMLGAGRAARLLAGAWVIPVSM